MKKIFLCLICLFIVTGCKNNIDDSSQNNVENNSSQNEAEHEPKNEVSGIQKLKEEYESLNETYINMEIDTNAKVEYLDVKGVVDFLKNKTGIIYFGFPRCPWCRNVLPILLNVSIDNNETVYYFNPRELRDTDNEDFNKIMNILDEYLSTDAAGEKTLYVPDIYFVKDGKVMGHFLGSVESQTDPFEVLNQEQKEELYNIYNDLLNKIK